MYVVKTAARTPRKQGPISEGQLLRTGYAYDTWKSTGALEVSSQAVVETTLLLWPVSHLGACGFN